MCLIKRFYKKNFLCRYDEDPAIPYFRGSDFPNLHMEENTFVNSKGIEIHYFFYYYDNYKKDKVVLFCHGLGPGHSAYLAEINETCKAGYKVLTLDYSGCGFSKGDSMWSVNAPARDVNELLNHLNLKEEIVLFGHSLGGYTALKTINIQKDITKAVVLSGFLSIENEMRGLTKSKFIAKRISSIEKQIDKEYETIDNKDYLRNTKDKILFIQSTDDQMVPFTYALGEVKEYNNPNVECVVVEGKKHNPNYTYDAVMYMNNTFYEYNTLIKNKTLNTVEKRKEFMSDKSIYKMTEQDPEIMGMIFKFIN